MSKYKTKLPTVEQMLEAGVHFGHQVRRKNPKMEKYIYGAENRTNIIDLFQTQSHLERALDFLYEVSSSNKQVIFVGTKRQASAIVRKYAEESGALYVNQRWLGGTITNFESVKSNCDSLIKLEDGMKTGAFAHYTKKERLLIDRKIEKLETFIGGIRNIEKYPGAIIVVDVKREKTAVREANALNIPVIALVDTNSDPEKIDYVVPSNDDAMKAIDLIFSSMSGVLKEGYEAAKERSAKEALAKEDASPNVGKAPKPVAKVEVKTEAKPDVKKKAKTSEKSK